MYQETQRKLNDSEYARQRLEDNIREADRNHNDEVRRLNAEIYRLNERSNVIASDSMKQIQQLND